MKKEIMIVAAEASSSHYALLLIKEMQNQDRDLHFFGVGSMDMEKEGFERIGKSEEMAVVGASEILQHFSELKKIFYQLVDAVKLRKPRLVIVMDYPEFNLYLSRKIFPTGVPVFYYISPQVWAWRKGRVHTIKRFCEKVFLLFPFEIPFYSQHQVPYDFVGHPLLDEIDDRYFDPQYLRVIRNQKGIADNEVVLGLMPGSRRLELKKHFQIQLDVARTLYGKIPHLKIVIMVAPTFEREDLLPYLEDMKFPFVLLKDDPFRMIAISDFVLAASGTATLMVGLLEKPMVIMYKMSWLTSKIAKVFVRGVKYFGLVNLILGSEVAPERMQQEAREEVLEPLLFELITQPEKSEKMRVELRKLRFQLGEKGATKRVAGILKSYLQ